MRGNLNNVIHLIRARMKSEKASNWNTKLSVLLDLVEEDNTDNNSDRCRNLCYGGSYHSKGCTYCYLKKIVYNCSTIKETATYEDGFDCFDINYDHCHSDDGRMEELYSISSENDTTDDGEDCARLPPLSAKSPTLTRSKKVLNFDMNHRTEQ